MNRRISCTNVINFNNLIRCMQNTFLFDVFTFHDRTGIITLVFVFHLCRVYLCIVSNELGGRRIVLFATLPAHPGRTESPTPIFYWLIKFKIKSSTTGSFFLRKLQVVISEDIADTKVDINLCPPENLELTRK